MDCIKRIGFYVLLFVCFLALSVGCTMKNTKPNEAISLISKDKPHDIESWVGEYSFSEHAPPDQSLFYTVTIDKENSAYYAEIYIDGFQSLTRLKAKVSGNKDSIKLLFDKYLPDNMFESYKKGDVLLSFKRKNSRIYTYWGKIVPMQIHMKSGKEYFVREK